jgi:hypothetical protein
VLEEKLPIHLIEELPEEELEESHNNGQLIRKLRTAIEEVKEEEDSMDNESELVIENSVPNVTFD